VIRAREPGSPSTEARPRPPVAEVAEDDLAAIIYTSGTTGKSKGVMLTHRNICHNASASRLIQPVNEHDRFLSILPLSHTYENTLGLILPLISGARSTTCRGRRRRPCCCRRSRACGRHDPGGAAGDREDLQEPGAAGAHEECGDARAVPDSVPPPPAAPDRAGSSRRLRRSARFFGVGGAKLDPIVDRFLAEARFPYAIGYG